MNLEEKRALMLDGACKALCRTWSKPPDGCAARCLDRLGSPFATGCKYATEVHGQAARAVLAAWDILDADIVPLPPASNKLQVTQEDGGEIEIFTQHFGKRMPLVSVLYALAGQEGNDGDEGNAMQMAGEVIEDLMDAAVARDRLAEIEADPGSLVTLSDLHGIVKETCGRQPMNCTGAKRVRDMAEKVDADLKGRYGGKRYSDKGPGDEGC